VVRANDLTSDPAVLELIGTRIARQRLEQNRTQASVAAGAGISVRTLIRMESGEDVSLVTFIRILRELGQLENLAAMLPEPGPSPMERLKMQGKQRKRAS
jgi:transcriptional regulator with XRE-family HTH domain